MELIFLGTSSGTPSKTRNVSACAIRMSNKKQWHLVDCGEGTQHQILHTNLALKHLRALFITHVHGDHCYGLPGLLANASLSGRTEPLIIVAPKPIHNMLSTIQVATQLKLTFDIEFIDVNELHRPIETKEFFVEVIELSHRVPSFAFAFIEKNIKPSLNVDKLIKQAIPSGPAWGRTSATISGNPTAAPAFPSST